MEEITQLRTKEHCPEGDIDIKIVKGGLREAMQEKE